ncbi:MAG: hypothetical protein NTX50_11150 [Candidatus Sumerlaeota bacterium]|nr:hypothetical protein [Candidatus Sumerlaeota bacterium]
MVLGAFARYAVAALNSSAGRTSLQEIFNLGREELGLRFLKAWLEEGMAMIVSSGTADKEAEQKVPFLLIEKMIVTSADGQRVIILYQFDHQPDAQERQDVVACLAQIIEQTRIANLSLPETQSAKSELKIFVIGQ